MSINLNVYAIYTSCAVWDDWRGGEIGAAVTIRRQKGRRGDLKMRDEKGRSSRRDKKTRAQEPRRRI